LSSSASIEPENIFELFHYQCLPPVNDETGIAVDKLNLQDSVLLTREYVLVTMRFVEIF
jgi:hypothetical protein